MGTLLEEFILDGDSTQRRLCGVVTNKKLSCEEVVLSSTHISLLLPFVEQGLL